MFLMSLPTIIIAAMGKRIGTALRRTAAPPGAGIRHSAHAAGRIGDHGA
jgi:hypothetical protein